MSDQIPKYTKIFDTEDNHIITRDNVTGLEWTARDIGRFTNRVKNSEAEAACLALDLGGHDDWRLPTADELESIRDRSRFSPAIDTDAFPDCPSAWFWSSTSDAASPSECAWVVSFYSGYSHIGYRGADGRVRAVRGPSDLPF